MANEKTTATSSGTRQEMQETLAAIDGLIREGEAHKIKDLSYLKQAQRAMQEAIRLQFPLTNAERRHKSRVPWRVSF